MLSFRSSKRRQPLVEIQVRVTPRASRTKIEAGDPVRIYVTAAPTDGEANRAVLETLSKALGIAKSKMQIVRGETSRAKTIAVQGLSAAELAVAIAKLS